MRVVTDEKVVAWRARGFLRMGFTAGQALTLAANGDVDLHEMEKWRAFGCTCELALRIVAPVIELPTSQELELFSGEME